MFCPNCGNQGSTDQKFCRSRGMNLMPVSEVLVGHLAVRDAGGDKSEGRAVGRMGMLLFTGIVVLMLGGIVAGLGRRMFPNDILVLLGMLMVLTGTMLAVYAVLSPLWRRPPARRRNTRPVPEHPAIDRRTQPAGLPPPPASRIETTPRKLEPRQAENPGNERRRETAG